MATEKRLTGLVSANALIEHLERCMKSSGNGLCRSVCVAIKCYVEQMPKVSVVHGEWNTVEDDYCGMVALECSVCNAQLWFEDDASFGQYHYCPNCGAKMDGDGNG